MKSYLDFLNEGFIFESKSKSELDMPQRNDWVEKIILKDWDKENGGELEKAKAKLKNIKDPDEKAKAEEGVNKLTEEITGKIKKDPKFGKTYNEYLEKNDRYYKLVDKLNKAGGPEKFKKDNAKEYNEVLDLHGNHISPFTLTQRPGGVLQISSQDMDGGDDTSELGAEAFRKKMNDYIDKNGKPKGVIMDLRANTGGSQETAKGMTDYFVNEDDYPIEQQKYSSGVRRFRDLPYPEGLKKALEATGQPKIEKYLETLSEDDKKKYWEESKKNGDLSFQNNRKNKVDAKYRLSGIPTVVQTSVRTFSAGEFTTDTIKNLNPNAVHVGHNSGGGANQTFDALLGDEKNNKDKSTIEKAKLSANAYKFAYWNEEDGKKIHDAILAKIKSGEINDKMDAEKLSEVVTETGRTVTGDDHIECHVNDGNIDPMVPQVKSDRTKVDPKTKKPILKDGKLQFDGNWERTGVGAAKTAAFIESDPNDATKDALEYIYQKNGDTKLLKELKTDPSKFGIDENGKDGLYDSESLSKQSAFVISGNVRQSAQLETSIKAVELNKKNKKSIAEQLEDAEKAFRGEDEKVEAEVKNTENIFAGFNEDEVKKLKDTKVTYKIAPNAKPREIQLETLLDWIPVDLNDKDEVIKLKTQKMWYIKLNKIREDKGLKLLVDFELWTEKRMKNALKNNKEYQLDVKNKNKDNKPNITNKPKPKNEGRVLDFKSFISENID